MPSRTISRRDALQLVAGAIGTGIAGGWSGATLSAQGRGTGIPPGAIIRTVLKDLPPRMNRDERIELTSEQRETYRRAEEEGVLRLADMGREATIRHVFELVLRLKQICNFDTATGARTAFEVDADAASPIGRLTLRDCRIEAEAGGHLLDLGALDIQDSRLSWRQPLVVHDAALAAAVSQAPVRCDPHFPRRDTSALPMHEQDVQ